MKFLLILVVALAVVTIGPWSSVCAQTGNCLRCGGTPQAPACMAGYNVGHVTCQTSATTCTATGDCGSGHGCFVAGMLVETPSGAIAIEDLQVGDKVFGRADDGTIVLNEVIQTYKTLAVEYLVLNGEISVTGTHPFLVGNVWVDAHDIRVGDVLAGPDGTAVPVSSIEAVDYGVRVFNISVSGNHSFFAGGILVHNKGPNPED